MIGPDERRCFNLLVLLVLLVAKLWDFYLAHDGLTVYGYPLTDEYATDEGTRQDFQTGYLTWDAVHGVVGHSTGCV